MASPAGKIEPAQHVLLPHPAAQPAARPGAEHVEQADQRQRRCPQARRHVAKHEVAREVRRDEGKLEAAGEETECEENVAAMAAGERQHVAERVGQWRRAARRDAATPVEDEAERRHGHHQDGQRQQRDREAGGFAQELRRGHQGELAERSAGARQPHRHAAALGRRDPADRGEDHRERGATHANAHEQAHTDHQQEARGGVRRQRQAGGERHRAEADNGRRAVAVGGGTGKGLRKSPDQVVQGDRNSDGAER